MKKLIFSSLVGLALVAFTGCTTGSDADTGSKCSASSKCAGNKAAKKCASSTKCAADKMKEVAKKCAAGKCGK